MDSVTVLFSNFLEKIICIKHNPVEDGAVKQLFHNILSLLKVSSLLISFWLTQCKKYNWNQITWKKNKKCKTNFINSFLSGFDKFLNIWKEKLKHIRKFSSVVKLLRRFMLISEIFIEATKKFFWWVGWIFANFVCQRQIISVLFFFFVHDMYNGIKCQEVGMHLFICSHSWNWFGKWWMASFAQNIALLFSLINYLSQLAHVWSIFQHWLKRKKTYIWTMDSLHSEVLVKSCITQTCLTKVILITARVFGFGVSVGNIQIKG